MRAALTALLLAASTAQAIEEVPYITTPDSVTRAMLDLAKIEPTDFVIDLGSGDGRIVIAAARRGARGLGIEINPDLIVESVANAHRAGVSSRAHFREQDLFRTDLTPASVITMYLLPEVNLKLRPKLLRLRPGTRIVSHDWDMGDWRPDKTVTLDVPEKKIGLEKTSKAHLWVVPARMEGRWCRKGVKTGGPELRLRQEYQDLGGELTLGETQKTVKGTIRGFQANLGAVRLRYLREGELQVHAPSRQLASASGTFVPCRAR